MPLQYTPQQYIAMLKMSQEKHLLVEGKDDKRCFEELMRIFGQAKSANGKAVHFNVRVESAESIIQCQNVDDLGNRRKVETIAEVVAQKPYANKFVGFVDREFRRFQCALPDICDQLTEHYVDNRLVWSRGHSIENYCFDFEVLRGPMQDNTGNRYYNDALENFKDYLIPALQLAAAMGIVGNQNQILKGIRNLVDWKDLKLTGSSPCKIGIEGPNFILRLRRLLSGKFISAEYILDEIKKYQAVLEAVDDEVVKWSCDGHIGHRMMWATYCMCVLAVCERHEDEKDAYRMAESVLRLDESTRFYAVARSWAESALKGHSEYPVPVLKLLGCGVLPLVDRQT